MVHRAKAGLGFSEDEDKSLRSNTHMLQPPQGLQHVLLEGSFLSWSRVFIHVVTDSQMLGSKGPIPFAFDHRLDLQAL